MTNPFWVRCDWINPFRATAYNWIDFTAAHLGVEYDRRFGNFEFHVALAGFHLGGRWKVAAGDATFQAQLEEMMRDMGLEP